MSRRFPRVRARFVATAQIGGVEHSLICHTRDISLEGCFLETSERLALGADVSLVVMDNEHSEVVSAKGTVVRVLDGYARGVGLKLISPPEDWALLVKRFEQVSEAERHRPSLRMAILVVSSEENRRGALALYVSSGWDIRFAGDASAARDAMNSGRIDAVICEFEAGDDTVWPALLSEAKEKHPEARRIVRCKTENAVLPSSGARELVHRFVDSSAGIQVLLGALTEAIGEPQGESSASSVGAKPLDRRASQQLLETVLSKLRGENETLAVFDLDSTLLDNSPRQAAILREYGTEKGVVELAQSKSEHWDSWEISEAMANAGLDLEGIEEHQEACKAYWRERFFTSEYCKLDEAIAGAAGFVRAALGAGAKVVYVTGRHEEMRAGSVTCLERLGFPIPVPGGERVLLLMKPTLSEDDDVYKARTYAKLAEMGAVVAAFDNEPTHINGYRSAFPDAHAVHLATDHSGRDVQLADGVVSILDFQSSQ